MVGNRLIGIQLLLGSSSLSIWDPLLSGLLRMSQHFGLFVLGIRGQLRWRPAVIDVSAQVAEPRTTLEPALCADAESTAHCTYFYREELHSSAT